MKTKCAFQSFAFIGMIVLFLFTLIACKKDKNIILPTVTIIGITDITSSSAKITTMVTDEGGSTVTGTGVCWGKSNDPDLSDDFCNVGGGLGQFISIPDNLESSTTYYVRAFATNEVGTAYSDNRTFITLN